MWNRKTAVPGLLAAAALIAGACSDVTTPEPVTFDEQVRLFGAPAPHVASDAPIGMDAILVRIAQQNPGFGGFFYDDNLALNIVSAGVQPLSLRALGASLSSELGLDPNAQPVRMVVGQYDFVQLDAMHRQISPVLGLEGVVYTDADERANRVAIGVVDEAARAAVERVLAMTRVPREAVEIRESEPVFTMQTLRDRVRPVAGGLQINFPGFLCTLGLNVRAPGTPDVHGFLTNSHCSNVQWQQSNTPYWQPSGSIAGPADPNYIGREEHDAPGFTGAPCPAGRICRYSDAAGARYAPGVPNAFARIYRTTGFNSLTINQANPYHNIVAENPTNTAMGDSVYKVGRTTGFTRGVVTGSCVNTNLSPNYTYLCHDWMTGPSGSVGGGDSGSSTWTPAPLGQLDNVRVNGLLCCGAGSTIFIHSPMSGIRTDNPPPNPANPWRIFPPPPAP